MLVCHRVCMLRSPTKLCACGSADRQQRYKRLTESVCISGAHAGIIPTNTFVNDTLGAKYVAADGQW